MLFGYARVSDKKQNLAIQISALKAFGVEDKNIYAEKESGAITDRAELEKILNKLREGDLIVFYDLSRVGRDFHHLINLVSLFEKLKVDFKDLTNPSIDTKSYQTPEGKLIFRIFSSVYTFFREQSNEKVRHGLEEARKEGRIGGRPRGLSKDLIEKSTRVVKLYTQTDMSINEIATTIGIAPNSVYKCLNHMNIKKRRYKNKSKK